MPKKLTQEEFITRARKVHGDKYDYSKVEYKNIDTKVIIIDKEFGEFQQTPWSHLHSDSILRRGEKLRKIRAKSTAQFIQEAKSKHGDRFDYSKVEYINASTPVTIICPEHGEFKQTPATHLKGTGCPRCGRIKANKSESLKLEGFLQKAKEIHGNKYDYSKVDYINSKTKICIICPKHGEFWQSPNDHLRGKGCRQCYMEVIGKNKAKPQEIFIQQAMQIHNNKYDYSKVVYTNSRSPITIICPKHGEFQQPAGNHLLGFGCPKCTLKAQTKLFEKLQQKLGIPILFEVDSKIVTWLGRMRLDMFIPDYNIAIEYDGIQHCKPIKRFGGDLGLNKTQIRDRKKDELCANNLCTLFRVPYNYTEEDFNNLVTNIKDIINNYGKA